MCTSLGALILAAFGQVTSGQDGVTAQQTSLERIVADLSEFTFSMAGETDETLTLSCTPVLRWSNPIRNVDDSAVFICLSKDRPELLTTVMSYRDARHKLRRAYEFLSLSQYRLEAIHKGERMWHPEQPGFTWRVIPESPRAATTPAERLRQMRNLASMFRAAVQSDNNRYELRLLSQPLYRYHNAKAGILDGALFAFVEGTDPELILGLETSRDRQTWEFAVGRLTRWAIDVRYQDKSVSGFPQMTGAGKVSDTYLIPDAGPLEPASKSGAASREKR